MISKPLVLTCCCLRAPEIDMTELESLFSSAPEEAGKSRPNSSRGPKPEKVQLVNCVF